MYYVLRFEFPRDEDDGYYDINDGLEFEGVRSWAMGVPFTAPLPNPIIVELTPTEAFKGLPPEMCDGNMLLMSTRLVQTLLGLGIRNLDCYPAILRDEVNHRDFDYQAVNILGLMQVADLKKSKWENFDGEAKIDTHFEELVIDENRCRGQEIFRLAEDTGTILIHERVKQALEAVGFPTLRYLPAAT